MITNKKLCYMVADIDNKIDCLAMKIAGLESRLGELEEKKAPKATKIKVKAKPGRPSKVAVKKK